MPNPLARQTISSVESALADKRSTAINEIVQLIQQLAGKAFSISIDELSQLVGRDPTITAKVVSAANTLGFNPNGIAISTLSDAIHTIGFEKVRNLSISLLLAENSGQRANSYEQRNVAALCVCSGMIAQSLVRRPETTVNPDLLFVCASLRQYGRLLLCTFLLDRYGYALELARKTSEDEAFREVFGLSPLELARHVLRGTNLPKKILHSLRDAPRSLLAQPIADPDDEILALSELAVSLSTVAFDERIGPAHFHEALSETLARFAASTPTSMERVNEALVEVEGDIAALNRAVGLSERDSPATNKLQARLNGDFLPQSPAHARRAGTEPPKPLEDMSDEERLAFSDSTFAKAAATLRDRLKPGERVDLAEIFGSVAQAFRKAAELENCLIFVREEFDPNSLSARYGEGPLYDRVKNRPLVSPTKGDIFSICLTRKEDILIQDTQAGKIRSIIPDWIHSAGDTSSFIILPVKFDAKLFAIIVGTVSNERHIDLKEGDLRNLRAIRAQLGSMQGMIETRTIKTV